MACVWSSLNNDLLRLIASRLRTLEDFTRLGAVCKIWMSVLMKQAGSIFGRPQLPWLMLPCDHDNNHPCQPQCQARRCFSIMENKVHHLYFPDSYSKNCVGSSHGWLVMVEDVSPAIFMLNPLTKQRIELPPVTTMPEILGFNKEDVGREYICRDTFYGGINRKSLKDIEEFFTLKIILSNDPEEEDCIVVALVGVLRRLVFCRIGDNKWTQVEHDLKSKAPQNDVVDSKGKFYVVTCEATIGVFDVRNPRVTTLHDTPFGINTCHAMYLAVDTSGALLLISKLVDIWDSLSETEHDADNNGGDNNVKASSNRFYRTQEFNVFKLDEENNKWNKVKDIGENVVFLGDNQSICYSTIEFPECKRNSIYFTDDNRELQGGIHEGHDIGIFNIEDGLIRKIPCFNEDMPLMTIFPRPVWFTPSIRSYSRIKTV